MGDSVCVCYRTPDQEEQVGETYRQLEVPLCLWDLVLVQGLNCPSMCWRDKTAGRKQCGGFLESTGGQLPDLQRSVSINPM